MIKLQISVGALIFFAALLLLIPLNWLWAAMLAALIHELCHFLSVCVLGGRVREIRICGRGVVMVADPLPPLRQVLSTLAGPLGSLLLLFAARWLPRTAICGLVQGVFNLLPLLPLDGGRVLESVLFASLSPPRAKRVLLYLQRGVILLLLVFCVLLAVRFGSFLLLAAFFLLQRGIFGSTIETISLKRYGYDRITETYSAYGAETCPVHRRRI